MTQTTKRIVFWTVAVAFIAFCVYIVISGANGNTIYLPGEVNEADHTKGNPNAEIVIVEYSDLQCPACTQYHELVKEVISEYEDEILFVYRHFPLKSIHPNAVYAARATEAAAKQNKFWEMLDILFANQREWATQNRAIAEDYFVEAAGALNLNVNQFQSDYTSDDVAQIVEDQFQSARKANLSYTPTFFLNGELIENPRNLEEFKQLIENGNPD